MPVLAVKPDGTKLFLAWYDRRNDPENSLIDVYGRVGTIAGDGSVDFGDASTEFRISTVSFPPVFAGTRAVEEPIYKENGYYDPAYPPGGVNLHWWYAEWPDDPSEITTSAYSSHVGEYNGAWAEGAHVYLTWSDNRILAPKTLFSRHQNDIRLVKFSWP